MYHPINLYWRVYLLVVVDIVAGNAPGKGLLLYGVVLTILQKVDLIGYRHTMHTSAVVILRDWSAHCTGHE